MSINHLGILTSFEVAYPKLSAMNLARTALLTLIIDSLSFGFRPRDLSTSTISA